MYYTNHCFHRERTRSILLIFENEEDGKLLREVLEEDYEVLFVADETKIDTIPLLVILHMDRKDHRERQILSYLKEEETWKHVPVILVSKDPQVLFYCHYMGGQDAIEYPYPIREKILATVKRVLLSSPVQVKEPVLLKELDRALKNEEIEVYYQPKFNIRGSFPVLSSAEALVRWNHPTLGLLMPCDFIPLLEEEGRIYDLDLYVWKKSARQIREWKERQKISVPVSVNVSRLDLNNRKLICDLEQLMKDNELSCGELLLEITESAYSGHCDETIERINTLRSMGFFVEMDDFGTGYSSLSEALHLPIDAMKVDMRFVKEAFSGKEDTGMLEILLKIASYLHVLAVAEGVEEKRQVDCLKDLGFDIVQGYFFSKPVKAKDFEVFLEEKMKILSISP